MRAPQGTEFCVGCPCIPEGVRAQIDTITPTTMAEYRGFVITHNAPDLVQDFVENSMNLTASVVESTNPDAEVGDDVAFKIERNDMTEEDVVKAFQNCPGPKQGRIAKMLGQKGTCQAITLR